MTNIIQLITMLALLPAGDMNAIQSGFFHILDDGRSADTARGEIYIVFPALTHIHITQPVNQIMRISTDEMIIYYPDTKEAFVYKNPSPISTSWLTNLGKGAIENTFEGIGLKSLNKYSIADKEVSFWEKPKKKKEPLLRIRVIKENGLLSKLVFFNEDGETLAVNNYGDYKQIADTFYLPTHIENVTNTTTGKSREIIILSSPEALSRAPAEIIDFKIPPDAHINTYE